MTDLQPLMDYATVKTWLDGLRKHWGGGVESGDEERLEILEAFCGFAGKDPDSVIDECVLVRDGEKRVRAKGRRRYANLITQFQAQVEGSRMTRGKWGNTVRSFLIHNGILLQAGLQAGDSETAT